MATAAIRALADAITRMEGYAPGTRAWRNNNPGNLRDYKKTNGQWAIWPTLPHDDKGFPQFATPEAGRAALERDLGLKVGRGMTLEQIIYAWAPPSDGNNTAQYLANVVAWTKMPAGAVPGAGGAPGGLPGSPVFYPGDESGMIDNTMVVAVAIAVAAVAWMMFS